MTTSSVLPTAVRYAVSPSTVAARSEEVERPISSATLVVVQPAQLALSGPLERSKPGSGGLSA